MSPRCVLSQDRNTRREEEEEEEEEGAPKSVPVWLWRRTGPFLFLWSSKQQWTAFPSGSHSGSRAVLSRRIVASHTGLVVETVSVEEEEEKEEAGEGRGVVGWSPRDAREEQVQPGGRCGGLEGAAPQRGGVPAWDSFPSQGEVTCVLPACFDIYSMVCVCVCVCVVLARGGRCTGSIVKFERDQHTHTHTRGFIVAHVPAVGAQKVSRTECFFRFFPPQVIELLSSQGRQLHRIQCSHQLYVEPVHTQRLQRLQLLVLGGTKG